MVYGPVGGHVHPRELEPDNPRDKEEEDKEE